ncbi:helix-turn-helix domain-containing protein [Nonomuraea sp. NPDC050328]|uniref:helix-turn-helix domain-containing protein n=1 Tax=Nonomuraea sp. NPDC050328 TaxID=3364361 RepID=UPI00378B4E73
MTGLRMSGRAPGASLRPFVTRLVAYREEYGTPLERDELPFPGSVLIFCIESAMEVDGVPYTSFTGGLTDRATATRISGPTEGVEVMLTPLGARRLLGVPMSELTNLTVPADEVLGGWSRAVSARLAAEPSWAGRLTLVEELVGARLAEGPATRPEIAWAWGRLVRSGGRAAVAELAAELEWSHRHLVARFHDGIGLAPKAAARIIRFDRALGLVRAGRRPAEVAAECGFFDQAHLNREFRALAGAPPGRFVPIGLDRDRGPQASVAL